MDDEAERMRILEMIESGSITAEQGMLLLQALNGGLDEDDLADNEAPIDGLESREDSLASLDLSAPIMDLPTAPLEPWAPPAPPQPIAPLAPAPAADVWPAIELPDPLAGDQPAPAPEILSTPASSDSPHDLPAEAARWKRLWMIPLWIGVGVTVLGGLLMFLAVRPTGAVTGWFLCASVPFALGVLVLALAWASRSAPWLHLRVQQAPGATPQRIALSVPLPLGLAAWFLRTFGRFIPNLADANVDQMVMAVGRNATPENPIYIQVDEGDDGEKVEIFIG